MLVEPPWKGRTGEDPNEVVTTELFAACFFFFSIIMSFFIFFETRVGCTEDVIIWIRVPSAVREQYLK